jgi:hypothetical protein
MDINDILEHTMMKRQRAVENLSNKKRIIRNPHEYKEYRLSHNILLNDENICKRF